MSDSFKPFTMPDFKSRPDDKSKSINDAYIYLRNKGVPDKNIFIYPLGEFNKFKGDIMDQNPEPGEIISSENNVVLAVNRMSICDLMPDLFTDHRQRSNIDDLFAENFSSQTGARMLFSIFDSACLKMLCRLEWIRDIYAGLYLSDNFIDYFSSFLSLPERENDQINPEIIGFVLPKLYQFMGTEGALKVYMESVLGLKCSVSFNNLQTSNLPENLPGRLMSNCILGKKMYLGKTYKSPNPLLTITFRVKDMKKMREIIPGGKKHKLFITIIELCLPGYSEEYKMHIQPDSDEILFIPGETYLGYSAKLADNK